MSIPGPLRVVAVGLVGLVLAAGLGLAASRLAAQHIGLSSEPLSAGDRLIPATARHKRLPPARGHRRDTATTTTTTTTTTLAPQPANASPPTATFVPGPANASPPTASPPVAAGAAGESGESSESRGDD